MMLIGVREAFALGTVAIGFRLFYAIYVENPQTINASWLVAIVAMLIVMPMAIILTRVGDSLDKAPAQRFSSRPWKTVFAIIVLFGLYDASGSINLFSHSASYMALENIPNQWIRLTCVAAAALGCLGGLDAIGSTARIWIRILFWLMIIIVVSLVGKMDANYIFPILGPGVRTLSNPLLPCAGVVCSILPIWLFREKPQEPLKRFNIVSLCATVGIVVAALLLLTDLILPPMLNIPNDRTFQLDKLLTNGRVNVLLQFPLLFVWFGCYISSLSYSLVFTIHSLGVVIPALPKWLTTLICAFGAFALSFLNISGNRLAGGFSTAKLAAYYSITVVILVSSIISIRRSRKPK